MGMDSWILLAAVTVLIVVFCLMIGYIAMRVSEFMDELRYINMEIRRVGPRERAAWRRRRRRLWLSLLPFFKE